MYNIPISVNNVNLIHTFACGGDMINEKMRKLGSERSEIRELFEYGIKRKAEIGEENVFDFSLGNPSIPCPDAVNLAMERLIKESEPTRLHGYTSAAGDPSVREAIANHITGTHGLKVSADDLYMTVGAAAALTCALHALVSDNEEVLVIAPYFPEYKVFIEQTGAKMIAVPSDASFQPDVRAIEAALNDKTAAVILNYPNNPTGAIITEERLLQIANCLNNASKKFGKDIYLISDEPYRELVYDGVSVPFIPGYYDNTIVCYSYSKSLSIPGERIGYCLVSPNANNHKEIYRAVCGAGRALGYVCAPALLQKMLPHCLGMTSDIDVYDKNRQLLLTKLSEYGFEMVKPQGAFYLFLKSPTESSREFSKIAMEHELLLVPSDSFGYPGYVRISYCVKTELIEKALPAFKTLAERMQLLKGNI